MTTTRRNVLWPLMIMAVGGIWLLMVADAFPDAVDDILTRAWPALPVLFGFDVLFGRRRLHIWRWRVETSLAGVVIVLFLVGGVVWFAYQKQADVVRADNVKTFSEVLSEDVNRVRLEIALERTSITIKPAEDDPRRLGVTFMGSSESRVEMVWSSEGDTGVLTVEETYRNAIPKLEDYGRGTLEISLPTSVIIEQFDLNGGQGDVTVDLRPVHMRQILLTVDQGDIQLSLPALDVLQGDLRTSEGSIELLVPPGRALDVKLSPGSGTPRYRYDEDKYDVLLNGEIKPANTTAFQYALNVWLKEDAWFIITDLE
jgi:hypothetical protein